MKNFRLWRWLRRKPPRDAEARRAFAERMRREAFGLVMTEQEKAQFAREIQQMKAEGK